MKTASLRRIESQDIETVVALWRRSREDAQPWLEARMGHTPAEDLAFFRDDLIERCEIWLAVEASQPQGLLAIEGDQVEQLYVEPAAQGRGHGTALLDHAKQGSTGRLVLFTHQRNLRARRFYEARGFRAVSFGVSAPPESEPDVFYEWKATAV